MVCNVNVAFRGRFKLTISGGRRGKIKLPWQNNMILDQGLSFMCGFPSGPGFDNFPMGQVCVGSSSTTVTATDSGLYGLVARFSSSAQATSSFDDVTMEGTSTKSFTFARGAAAGNLSEVGLGPRDTSNTRLVARALILNSAGEPTTITVLSDEVLTVTWQLRKKLNWPTEPQTINYLEDGVPATTVATYKPAALRSRTGANASADSLCRGARQVGAFSVESDRLYSEGESNPSLGAWDGSLSSPSNTQNMYSSESDLVTFNPPISKTNEFKLMLTLGITLSRRAP